MMHYFFRSSKIGRYLLEQFDKETNLIFLQQSQYFVNAGQLIASFHKILRCMIVIGLHTDALR